MVCEKDKKDYVESRTFGGPSPSPWKIALFNIKLQIESVISNSVGGQGSPKCLYRTLYVHTSLNYLLSEVLTPKTFVRICNFNSILF